MHNRHNRTTRQHLRCIDQAKDQSNLTMSRKRKDIDTSDYLERYKRACYPEGSNKSPPKGSLKADPSEDPPNEPTAVPVLSAGVELSLNSHDGTKDNPIIFPESSDEDMSNKDESSEKDTFNQDEAFYTMDFVIHVHQLFQSNGGLDTVEQYRQRFGLVEEGDSDQVLDLFRQADATTLSELLDCASVSMEHTNTTIPSADNGEHGYVDGTNPTCTTNLHDEDFPEAVVYHLWFETNVETVPEYCQLWERKIENGGTSVDQQQINDIATLFTAANATTVSELAQYYDIELDRTCRRRCFENADAAAAAAAANMPIKSADGNTVVSETPSIKESVHEGKEATVPSDTTGSRHVAAAIKPATSNGNTNAPETPSNKEIARTHHLNEGIDTTEPSDSTTESHHDSEHQQQQQSADDGIKQDAEPNDETNLAPVGARLGERRVASALTLLRCLASLFIVFSFFYIFVLGIWRGV